MYPHQLIGKRAIRTNPCDLTNGNKDYSYTTNPLRILAATENHIVVEWLEKIFEGKKHILDNRWIDNNWIDYDELMKLADDNHVELMKQLNE